MPPRILLVAPPWRVPYLGSLALATLRPILESAGMEVDELHGAPLFPASPAGDDHDVDESYCRYLFAAALRECDVDQLVDEGMRAILNDANMSGMLYDKAIVNWSDLGADEAAVRARFRRDVVRANQCIELIMAQALSRDYDVVGFSLLFDDQVPAALALARRLRRERPRTKLVFGGAACFEEQADGLLASFPELDAVCHTEGEAVVVPLMRALTGAGALAEVPGVAWRAADGGLHHNPSPPLLRDLDTLPVPDYRPFLAQLRGTPWASHGARLLFETSRGCWWGQKSLCTFCGLNAEGLSFRSKSPERAYQEIAGLYRDYPEATYLQATDNIVDMKYLTALFPRLAELPREAARPLRMFYEVKSNMKPEQVAAMAAAGVDTVQPGIESFSDGVLDLMRKGCTALGQLQFLKWTQQSGINPAYNIIMCNPGEKPAWYRDMLELLPFIGHLPPPTGITPMLLERFSPYFMNPAEFGIERVRPKASYDVLYPSGVDLMRIAYLFDFDHPLHQDVELKTAYRALAAGLKRWVAEWRDGMAYFVDRGDRLLIEDGRGRDTVSASITGPALALYLYLDSHRSRAQIADAFPDLAAELVDCLLLTWLHRRWLVHSGERWLAVLPRKGPPAQRARPPRPKLRPGTSLQLAVAP